MDKGVVITLTDGLLEKIDMVAAQEQRTRNEFFQKAIDLYIADHEFRRGIANNEQRSDISEMIERLEEKFRLDRKRFNM